MKRTTDQCHYGTDPRSFEHKLLVQLIKRWILWPILLQVTLKSVAFGFVHNHCAQQSRASQFQLDGCHIPSHADNLPLSSASFLMSHNAATGYIKPGSLSPSGLTWRYSKNQVGSVYQQLDDGARALDLRPKLLANNTVIFQHGDINIPVLFETIVADAVQWCADNDDELVLLLPSNFAYVSTSGYYDNNEYYDDDMPPIVSAMAAIYDRYGVPYIHCNEAYGLTIKEAMAMATLPTGGYMMAMDGQNVFGSFCGKTNWIEGSLVTCYSKTKENSDATTSCYSPAGKKFAFEALKSYMLTSANGEATDDASVLGPPANLYDYPFNEIQGLWQVTTASAVVGVAKLSSILDDNKKSRINEKIVQMVYDGAFQAISLLAVDNVASNGNAILSVLRNTCGQSESSTCGAEIPFPRMSRIHLSTIGFDLLVIAYAMVLLSSGVAITLAIRNPRIFWTFWERLASLIRRKQHPSTGGDQREQPILDT